MTKRSFKYILHIIYISIHISKTEDYQEERKALLMSDEAWDDRVIAEFAWPDAVGVGLLQNEVVASVLKAKAAILRDNPSAEAHVVTVDEGASVAKAVNCCQVDLESQTSASGFQSFPTLPCMGPCALENQVPAARWTRMLCRMLPFGLHCLQRAVQRHRWLTRAGRRHGLGFGSSYEARSLHLRTAHSIVNYCQNS